MLDEYYNPKMKYGTKRQVLKGISSHVLDCPLIAPKHEMAFHLCKKCPAHNYFDGSYVFCDDDKSEELKQVR